MHRIWSLGPLFTLTCSLIFLILIFYLTTDPQELRYWQGGQFKFLNKQITLIKSVAVTLSVHCIDNYPEVAISNESSFTESFKQCHSWQHAQQRFRQSREPSGSLSLETCHFSGIYLPDGWISGPRWLIPSHTAAWDTDTCLLLQFCLRTWFLVSLCQFSTHTSWGDRPSCEMLRCCSHVMLSIILLTCIYHNACPHCSRTSTLLIFCCQLFLSFMCKWLW